jgi:DNA polymerase-3 subunit gamma/tau
VERVRGSEFADGVAVTTLSRMWQMLLKGIPEAEASSRPAGAAEMVLIRLAHAAHLPSPEDAARRLLELSNGDGGAERGPSAPRPNGGGGGASMAMRVQAVGQPSPDSAPRPAMSQPVAHLQSVPAGDALPQAMERREAKVEETPIPGVRVETLDDIADLCTKNRAPVLRAQLRQFVHLVKIEPGRLEIRLEAQCPPAIVNELKMKLSEWTGITWWVTLSNNAGAPTLVEVEKTTREARLVDARQDPDVAAILARFPGAKVTDVRIKAAAIEDDDIVAAPPAAAESADGDILPGDDIEF